MNRFDVIVIGAGPAGITAAYRLAERGIDVLVVERGERVGAKNMFGGVVVGDWFPKIVDRFWESDVVERPISRKRFSVLRNDLSVSLDFESGDGGPYGFTTFRPRFDAWYANVAQRAGARIITEVTVRGLLVDDNRVVGVRTDRERGEIYAKVVVLADGVNSILHRDGGHPPAGDGRQFSLGVKEVIKVDRDVFRRLGLGSEREGLSHEFIGIRESLIGGGFLYTNRDTLSIGVVVQLQSLIDHGVGIYEALETFREIPQVKSLIAGGKSLEYSAHLVPGAARKPSLLYSDGLVVVGDAAGLVLNTGLHFEGVNYAVASGAAAADAVVDCIRKRNYSRSVTKGYLRHLERYQVLPDLRTYRRAVQWVKTPAFHRFLPAALCGSLDRTFRSSMGRPKNKLLHDLLRSADGKGRGAGIKELYNAIRAYLW